MQKIPKIIHFFHDFGIEPYSVSCDTTFRSCYCSWQRFLPDYKIMHWHDKMPEFKQMLAESEFLRQSYKYKIWAFVSDYVRCRALYDYGGVYLDCDVEVIKNFDEFLDNKFFISTLGHTAYRDENVEPAVVAGVKGHIVFKKMLEIYNSDKVMNRDDRHIVILPIMQEVLNELTGYRDNSKSNMENYIEITYDEYKNAEVYRDEKFGIAIYPPQYFIPAWKRFGFDAITDKTVSIHLEKGSWWRSRIRFAALMKTFQKRNKKGLKRLIAELKFFKFIMLNKLLRKFK